MLINVNVILIGLDGQRIIIFGGTASVSVINLDPRDSLYELNLINFEWSIPKTSGKIQSSRIFHRANVIGKYMVISFGELSAGVYQLDESVILLLDISSNDEYIWTSDFVPLPASTPSTSATSATSTQTANIQQPDNNKIVIIGAVIGSLVGGILLSFGGFFLYKRNKNRRNQNNALPIPGNVNYYNPGQEGLANYNYDPTIVPAPVINDKYNHGQEAFPINNERSSQSINEFKREIQDLKQMVLQNNRQAFWKLLRI